ncbi:MAG: hypothetical protein HY815_07895 [Candidatus Riflebacteria bacterium]|nr:hypothetical protein [Candidatus Riflebacteria bacterium]
MTKVLATEPPSAQEIRRELVDLLVRELHGPAGGPEEEVTEARVHERYLLGQLAPRRQQVAPEEQDDIPVGGKDSSEDGRTELPATQTRTVFPSSFGLTFSVDEKVETLSVTVRWGQYARVTDGSAPGGEPRKVWRRKQIEGVHDLTVDEGKVRPVAPAAGYPDVLLRGLVRPAQSGCRIVTLFLVNNQVEPETLRGGAWLLQPELIVRGPGSTAAFVRHHPPRQKGHQDLLTFDEDQAMEMLYRPQIEFAVGHGVGVSWELDAASPDRARAVRTAVIPAYEVPRTDPPTAAEVPGLAQVELDMKTLGDLAPGELSSRLQALPQAYAAWIETQRARLGTELDLSPYARCGKAALDRCASARDRIQAGIELLDQDPNAAEAFLFMNRAMYLQRVRSLYGEQVRRGQKVKLEQFDRPEFHRWYPFQLAFILLNLPGITRLDHSERSCDPSAIADLLWFPTGGGKTEAYLGLTAYTLALRRLQGTVAGRPGEDGVAVLMRYTLRALTL